MKYLAESNNFSENLKNKVTMEPSFWFITPKVFNDKPFTGKINKSDFDLSLNSYFKSFKSIRIKGNYKKKSENLYSVEYDIDLPKGLKIFGLIVFIAVFTFFNAIVYKKNGKIESFPNVVALVFLLWFFLINTILKRLNRKKFENEFSLKIITITSN